MNPKLVEKYINIVDRISNLYQYDNNIRHLLYIIVPAFITKYSMAKEDLILSTLEQTKILICSNKSDTVQAYYTSIPHHQNGRITTSKYIVIQNYEKITLVKLLDSLVHEFNHAIHSYKNEILIKNDTLFLRTGLTYISYSLSNLNPLKKDDSYILEEILNTNQTEEIINIIKTDSNLANMTIVNTIYAINSETETSYQSKSYYLEHQILKDILSNKTFISTINALRISGDIQNIEMWFDNITNIPNSYQTLIQSFKKIADLEQDMETAKFLKKNKIKKIKHQLKKIQEIVLEFNQNCNYK